MYILLCEDGSYYTGSSNNLELRLKEPYLGACMMPPLCGILLERVSMSLYPVILLIVTVMIGASSETLNRMVKKR